MPPFSLSVSWIFKEIWFRMPSFGVLLSLSLWLVWPDLVIYWTFGNFLKPLATINLPKSLTFLGNFSSEGNFYSHLAIFSGHTVSLSLFACQSLKCTQEMSEDRHEKLFDWKMLSSAPCCCCFIVPSYSSVRSFSLKMPGQRILCILVHMCVEVSS